MDPDEDRDLVARLTDLAFLVQAAHERCAREHDVSSSVARLLGQLRERRPTMSELATLVGLDKSSTSGLVDRAQRRGLVRRLPSQLDRRSVRVRLTAEGLALERSLSARLATDVAALLEPLPDDSRETVAEALRTILEPR
jgi:DNA-binding MarR family transcriptional regulator